MIFWPETMDVMLVQLIFGCIMYADDIIILSPSQLGLQLMSDACNACGRIHDIAFNSEKYVCFVAGKLRNGDLPPVDLCCSDLQWIKSFNCLGIVFNADPYLC